MVIYHVYTQDYCGGGVTEEYSHEYFLNKITAEKRRDEQTAELKRSRVFNTEILLDEIDVDES